MWWRGRLLHAAMWCGRSLAFTPPHAQRAPPLDRRGVSAHALRASTEPAADLPARFTRALESEGLVGRGAIVLALVSGGRDSVALLHLLAHSRAALQLQLHVLHFNHRTRPECDEEEAFVGRLAAEHAAAFHVRRLERVPTSGLQAQTREWRRAEASALLGRLVGERAAAWGADAAAADAVIVLGHHADDDAETVLLKWLRGSHITNLAGMRPRDGAFVRPLLRVRKEELTAWLDLSGLRWMEDASNAKPDYKRNKVRLELLPLLLELTEGALASRLADLVAQGAEARRLLEHVLDAQPASPAKADGSLDVPELLRLPAAAQTEVLHRFIYDQSGRPSAYAEVQRVLAHARSANRQFELHLADGWLLGRSGSRLRVAPRAQDRPTPTGGAAKQWATARVLLVGAQGEVSVSHPSDCSVVLRAGEVAARAGAGGAGGAAAAACEGLVLFNVPPGSRLRVRARLDGDRITPAWRERPIKLKDFLRGQKVPLHERDSLRVVAWEPATATSGFAPDIDSDTSGGSGGEVLAVYPAHVSSRYAHDDGVHPPLRLHVESREASET